MKNIHLLPTDKASRLHLWTDENGTRLALCGLEYSHTRNTQNIYITSDEEITFKIILTTDQDLIKDGVQAIDDEFLEWFVKNPSCEEVEIEVVYETGNIHQNDGFDNYKIIIPKEELERGIAITHIGKQETLEEDDYSKILKATMVPKEYFGTKQETLEEAAENHQKNTIGIALPKHTFIEGAKWQQQNSYSEEEVELMIKIFHSYWFENNSEHEDNLKEWELSKKLFEQFKKG